MVFALLKNYESCWQTWFHKQPIETQINLFDDQMYNVNLIDGHNLIKPTCSASH
jgi:hypothetical protein